MAIGICFDLPNETKELEETDKITECSFNALEFLFDIFFNHCYNRKLMTCRLQNKYKTLEAFSLLDFQLQEHWMKNVDMNGNECALYCVCEVVTVIFNGNTGQNN